MDSHKTTRRFVGYFLYMMNLNIRELSSLHQSVKYKIPVINIDDSESIDYIMDLWTTFFNVKQIKVKKLSERTLFLEFTDIYSKNKVYDEIQLFVTEMTNAFQDEKNECFIQIPKHNKVLLKILFKTYDIDLELSTGKLEWK